MNKKICPIKKKLQGEITIPADKSISHRAIIFSTLAKGTSVIKNISNAADPNSTLQICKLLGAEFKLNENNIKITGGNLTQPATALFCGNSGTTMRLISGVLAGQNFNTILTGDESLSSRPMKRIIEPLTLMGAKIDSNNNKAPLKIEGRKLHGIDYTSKLASAQVKSAILLAGLFADGKTSFSEPYLSRNHTELMLAHMGADIQSKPDCITIKKSDLTPQTIQIAGDISSAAYFIAAALLIPNSEIIIKNVGLNPTRTGFLDVLKAMGANIEILDKRTVSNEATGDISVKYSELKSTEISGELIPRLIDEIPILAVLATQANGTTVIKDAQDLRNKESDRISTIARELKKLGACIDETNDGMIIYGKTILSGGCELDSYKDHRLSMSLYIAGLISEHEVSVKDFEWVNISFPEFEELFNSIK